VADRRPRSRHVDLEYAFDRLLARKLEQVYDILVPDRARRTGELTGLSGETDEGCRDIRPGLVRPTEQLS
jgi:site-specific DNA recombinase